MNDETPEIGRTKRPYVRRNVRQEDAREPVREAGSVRYPGKVRQRRGANHNMFEVPRDILKRLWDEYGVDIQFNLDTVKGADGREIVDLPPMVTRTGMEQQGWESVMPGQFDGLLDGLFVKKDHRGEIVVGGQVLQWRPRELTQEARAEEYSMAKEKVYSHEKRMMAGQVDGVDTSILDPRAGSAQRVTRLTKSRVPSIPVPQ